MSFLDRFSNKAPQLSRTALNVVDVRFHKEAFLHTVHGYLVVTNKQLGIKEAAVAFSFPKRTTAPELDARLIADLWEAAESQGFIPHRLVSYGAVDALPAAPTEDVSQASAAYVAAAEESHASAGFDALNAPAFLRVAPQPSTARPVSIAYAQEDRELDGLKAHYGTRLAQLSTERRNELDTAILAAVSNGRSIKREKSVIYAQVRALYDDALAFEPEAAGELQVRFPRLEARNGMAATH